MLRKEEKHQGQSPMLFAKSIGDCPWCFYLSNKNAAPKDCVWFSLDYSTIEAVEKSIVPRTDLSHP